VRKTLTIALIILIVVGGLFAAMKARAPKKPQPTTEQRWAKDGIPVQTAVLSRGNMERTVEVTGDISALGRVTLSAKIPGRVTSVSAREGDRVTCGQALVVLDQADMRSSLVSAQGGLQSAVARLSQAKTNQAVTKIQTDAAIEQALAQLNAAKARLAVVKQPSRSQERLVAENAVAEAKANLDRAAADYKRNKNLLAQGAISQSAFDVADTQYKVAQAQHKSASERLSMIKEGGRTEEITQAEAQVQVAQEALRTARANASQNMLRVEDVRQARAALEQAKAAVAIAQQQLSYCYVNAPISGVLSARQTEPGQVVSAGQSLGEVVNLGSIYFKGDVSEKQLAGIRDGQNVQVTVDAIPGPTFGGTLAEVYPSGSTASRNFSVRITIRDSAGRIRPGMFARGEIVTGVSRDVLLVPKDAIDEAKGTQSVYTVQRDRTVRRHIVSVIRENRDHVQVQTPTTLKPGDVVVTQGRQNLRNAQKTTKVLVSR
jgi:HlyD family secretion protein